MEQNKPTPDYSELIDEIDLEPVQPAKKSHRLVAGIIDIILVILVGFGLSRLLFLTPLGSEYTTKRDTMKDIEDAYKITPLIPGSEATYGHKLYSYEEGYEDKKEGHRIHQDEQGEYIVVNNDDISNAMVEAYKSAIEQNQEYMSARRDAQNINFALTAIPAFISEAIFLLVIPLLNKNKMTIGKMPFKLYLVGYRSFLPTKWWNLTLSFAFIVIIDTALPLYFLGFWTTILAPALLLLSILFSKRSRTLHDIISSTYNIEGDSYSPRKVEDYWEERR